MNQWTIAIRQIKHNPLRSMLMGAGVSIFAAVIVAVTLLMVGVNQSITQTVNRLGADLMVIPRGDQVTAQFNEALLSGKPTNFYLPRARLQEIQGLSGISEVAAQTYAQTLTNARCCAGKFFLVGFDRESDFTIQPWLMDQDRTWTQEDNGIIVGDRILLGLGETVEFYGTSFKVAGVLNHTGMGMDWTVYMPHAALRRMVDHSKTKAVTPLQIEDQSISSIFVRAHPGVDLIDLAERVEQAFPDCQAVLSSSVGKLARVQLKVVAIISLGVVGALWCVAALLSGVVVAQAVRERQSELGLFLAKGARKRFILGMLTKESLVVSLCASLVGAALAVLIVVSFRQLLAAALGIPDVLPSVPVILVLVACLCGVGTLTAMVCACLPAINMLRKEPFEAIKGGRDA
ncbi:MAG: FtsX-like permease family protein [Planctomycetes bacterium]|nr:FtsX-like permease family protein [Planctomycetota bacterium]